MTKACLPNWWTAEGTCFGTQPRNFWCGCLNALPSLTHWCLTVTNTVLQNVLTWHLDTFLSLVNQCYLHQHSLPFRKQKTPLKFFASSEYQDYWNRYLSIWIDISPLYWTGKLAGTNRFGGRWQEFHLLTSALTDYCRCYKQPGDF